MGKIIANQRKIIAEVTKKPASQTPQVWALYSEVQKYYDEGMKVPDDVIVLLCDDNWGDVRRLPELGGKKHREDTVLIIMWTYMELPDLISG